MATYPWDKAVGPHMAAEVGGGLDHIETHRAGEGHNLLSDSRFRKF